MVCSPCRTTVCVPVFRPGTRLAETLRSIEVQTYRDFRVHVSIDGGDSESESLCQEFLRDPRFHLILQPRRLGWVGNVNALLSQVDTELFCIQPHDDVIHETYLARLLEHLDRSPRAVSAFCDIRLLGERDGHEIRGLMCQASVQGERLERQRRLLEHYLWGIAWRGLTRASALPEAGLMRGNRVGNYAADVVWVAQLARAGELHRVPGELYFKHHHGTTVSGVWGRWPMWKKMLAWLVHCGQVLAVALPVAKSPPERLTLIRAFVSRLLNVRHKFEGQWIE